MKSSLYIRLSLVLLLVALILPVKAQESLNSPLSVTELMSMREQTMISPLQLQPRLLQIPQDILETDIELKAFWLLRLAETYNYTYQFQEFNQHIEAASNLIEHISNPRVIAMIKLYQGIRIQRDGDYLSARVSFREAIDYAQREDDNFVLVVAMAELAYTQSLEEEYEISLNQLQQAFIIASQYEQASKFLVAQVEHIYGALYAYMNKHEDSVKHYLKAQSLYEKMGSIYHQGEVAYGLASNYRRAKMWQKAIEWYQNYHRTVEAINSGYSLFFFQYGVGMTYAEMGDCESAVPVIDQALSTNEFKDYRAELYKKLAICQGIKGLFKEASLSLELARQIYQEIPELSGTSWEIECDKISAQLQAMQGNYESAYNKLEKYYQQLTEIDSRNNSKHLQNLKRDLQVEREKLNITKLENRTQLQQLKLTEQMQEIQTQRLWLVGSIIAIAAILVILWFQLRMSRQLKSLAITDELTGLFNRRFIFSTIEKMLSATSSKKVHHTLMLIDVDDLKPINDVHGHREGDKVLQLIADIGRKILRDGDVFARIGGDEFMLLMTRTDKELEVAIAKRILQSLSEASFCLDSGERLNVSVSIGICTIDNLSLPPESVYSQVDEALYRAKSGGRNRFSH